MGCLVKSCSNSMLSYIPLEAVVPLLGKQWKRDNPQTIPLAIKQDIGELFYGNARLHAAASLPDAQDNRASDRRRAS
jgi:hypothetical protein